MTVEGLSTGQAGQPGQAGAGLRQYAVTTWTQACDVAAGILQDAPGSPLELDLVVTPGPAHDRALSQALAARPGGPGISAGIEFTTPGGLWRRVQGDADQDPWTASALPFAVLTELQDDAVAFADVHRNLGATGTRPGRAWATANRIAGLMLRYARDAPTMVGAWSQGRDLDATGDPLTDRDLWQPRLWRALRKRLGDDPASRWARLLAQLRAAPAATIPARVVVLAVDDPPPEQAQLQAALAAHHSVHLIQLSGVRPRHEGDGSSFIRRYGRRAWLETGPADGDRATLLHAVQDELRHDRPPTRHRAWDPSLQVHACHGPDRQVEVLRDVVCGLLTDDPTLQPRDIVVLSPDIGLYAPLIAASFGLADDASGDGHPGHRLRAAVAAPSVAWGNPVLGVLAQLFALRSGRATVTDLIDLCQSPPVAHRFGLGRDQIDRLRELVAGAGIRWGMDFAQRARNGVGFQQSTWLMGVQRLLVSLALTDRPPVSLGKLTPVPGVDPADADIIGVLAEIVSRVRKTTGAFAAPCPAASWASRLREAIDLLIAVPAEDAWQVSHALSELARLSHDGGDTTPELDAGDVAVWLEARMTGHRRRPNFGTGSLLFAGLDDLAAIEARVICVLGLDDRLFPGAPEPGGDDLLARPGSAIQPHWTRVRRERNRQRLVDAVLAARDAFVVITQGADERTGETRPCPLCVAGILEAAGVEGAPGQWRGGQERDALVAWHPLQPYDWAAFRSASSEPPPSFDRLALRGALALAHPPMAPGEPIRLRAHGAPPEPEPVDLDDLIAFYQNPARELLRRRVGVTLGDHDRALDPQLPIVPDALQEWQVGTDLLDALVEGYDPGSAVGSEWLTGRVLPGRLGEQVLGDQLEQAEQIAACVRAAQSGPAADVDCTLDLGGGRVLTARVRVHGNRVVVYRNGRLRPADAIRAWMQLLALTAAGALDATGPDSPGSAEAVIIGRRRESLRPPGRARARDLLDEMVRLRDRGLVQVLPLPPATAATRYGRYTFRRGEPVDAARQEYAAEADRDSNWRYFFPSFDDLVADPPHRDDPPAGEQNSRFEALAGWLWRPMSDAAKPWRPQREAT